jgi:ATP adenylyltransferase
MESVPIWEVESTRGVRLEGVRSMGIRVGGHSIPPGCGRARAEFQGPGGGVFSCFPGRNGLRYRPMSDFQTTQQLWAPWRMEFIRAPKEAECFMCRILREGPSKDAENLVVRRGATCLLLMNRYPYTSGHLLVAPFRHEGRLDALRPEELGEMMELASLGTRLLERVAQPQGFNLGINQGAAAGAG